MTCLESLEIGLDEFRNRLTIHQFTIHKER
jgi:hypothetical protein